MANMHEKLNGNSDFQHLVKYYREQLLHIQTTAKITDGDYYFLDSDRLVEEPTETLEQLTNYLGLTTHLREKYDIFEDTGQAGKGDPSENIKNGKITKTEHNERNFVSAKEMSELTNLYIETRTLLTENSKKTGDNVLFTKG